MKRFYRTSFVILGYCVVHFDSRLLFAHAPVDRHPATDGFIPITHLSRFHHCLHHRVSPVDWFFRRTWRGCRWSHRPGGLLWWINDLPASLSAKWESASLAGVLLCSAAAIVSLGIFLRFRRYPIEDRRPMPMPVRISFGVFVAVLLLVGSAILLQIPNVFAWTLNPMSSALMGCFFLGSSCYFLYGLIFPRWHAACGQLWSFLAYDIVLIVPLLFHFATVSSAQLPSLIINTVILVYSGALAVYYLLIKKETRPMIHRARLSSQAHLLEWSR